MSSLQQRLTGVQWLVCIIASIGFAFDIYELLMLPLVLPDALKEFGATGQAATWRGVMFFVPALVGGLFGFWGGVLTDRFGRRRVLTASILLYAFSAFFAGFSTNIYMLLFLRCTTFIGVCVEFVAAVAWLAELFDDPHQREKVLGYTQAFSSIGGLMVAVANGLAADFASSLPAIGMPGFLSFLGEIKPEGAHSAWRYTLMSGLIPAIPLIVIRPFLPESPVWQQRKNAGTLRRPRVSELFQPRFRRTTIVTTIIMACGYGAAFGAIQQIQFIVRGLPQTVADVEKIKANLKNAPAKGPAGAAAPEKAGDAKSPDTKSGDAKGGAELKGDASAKPAEEVKGDVAAKSAENKPADGKPADNKEPAKGDAKKGDGKGAPPAGPKVPPEIQKYYTKTSANYTKVQEVGGLFGRFVIAILAVQILSRRTLLRFFQVPGLILMPIIFYVAAFTNPVLFSFNWGTDANLYAIHLGQWDVTLFHVGLFFAGFVTVAQFNFWGNYLPAVYPVHLRGTGESFAANIGGRMIGTSFAYLSSMLSLAMPVSTNPLVKANPGEDPASIAYAAAIIAGGVYLIGFIASFWLPEPPSEKELES